MYLIGVQAKFIHRHHLMETPRIISYDNSEECTISGVPPVGLDTVAFGVEAGIGGCRYDYLTVSGVKYCAAAGPSGERGVAQRQE